jgi:zinc protease
VLPKYRTLSELERVVLDNGLQVIVAPDRSTPLVALAIVYDVGFRSEPEGRTGFAHLFEHLMFQGSANVAKVEHIQLVESAGGVMNGHTMPDLTAYYEALPSGGLELALWLEADRMGSLAVNEENLRNQVAVVEEEIKVNVLNQPYGGFPWILMPALAFDSYPNAHNGYGDFEHLEVATIQEAEEFYADYYTPQNAVLAVAGDCDPEKVMTLAERHFGHIESRSVPPHGPWPEPVLASERRSTVKDPLIPQPAFALGYRTPDPIGNLEEYAAYAALASVLAEGDASRLRARLVHRDQTVTDIGCLLGEFGGDTFLMRDPVLFQVLVFHPGTATTDQLIRVVDEELERLAAEGPTPDEMRRVSATNAAEHWQGLDSVLNRALMLASVETIHGRAELVADLPERLARVRAVDVASAASDLLAQHRAVVELQPRPVR